MLLEPEEIFFRAFRHADFDICELSLSSYSVKTAAGTSPYIAVPVFPSRAFRHTSIYVRTDRIKSPADLKGRRVGVPEYQLTANIWVRLFLEEDYGVARRTSPGSEAATSIRVASRRSLSTCRRMWSSKMPARTRPFPSCWRPARLDAVIGPRAPSCFDRGHPDVGYLFADPQQTATDWYRRTRLFPIMHMLGIRRSLAEKHPWLPVAVFKAFERSKAIAVTRLGDTSATKVTLPFVEEQLRAARMLMGEDFWPYGLEPNRHVLTRFLQQHHAEGLSSRLLTPEELFHPASLELHKI